MIDPHAEDNVLDGNGHTNQSSKGESPTKNLWNRTGSISADGLLDARLQAHFAAHLVGAPAKVFHQPLPDFSHVSLHWSEESEQFSKLLTEGPVMMLSLELERMLVSLTPNRPGDDVDIPLHGRTLAEVQAAMQEEFSKGKHDQDTPTIPDPKEWPDHPVARGAAFDCSDSKAFKELAHHFNNAHTALEELLHSKQLSSPVRTWPHHFDMATLVSLDHELDPEEARSINVGFSPGDGQIAEPYWYVVPYPDPKRSELPALPHGGYWHTKGWTGAILEASSYANVASHQEQHGQVAHVLEVAYDACRTLLEEDSQG